MRCVVPFFAGLALIASSVGCGGGPCGAPTNELRGSVSETYDIEVDNVSARLSASQMTATIDFKHGNDSVAKVVALVDNFERGARIPLTNGDVFRVTSPDTQFPREIVRGSVTIDSALIVGQPIAGCFNAVFLFDDGVERTLEGGFEAALQEGL